MSLAPGPDLEGSRTVASSTPVRISVPLTEAPRRPDLSSVNVFGGQEKWGSKQAGEPEEIPDAEHELIIERVAAIDVAKASGKVCVRASKDAAGRRSSRVWDVAATTGAITELAAQLWWTGSRG